MNKGLELIEAHHLFALEADALDVVVHPQSVVHGLVEFRDGSVVAQLGSPDMRIPIAHCLAWPVRMGTPAARLDLARLATLTFEEPDLKRFPALALARRALAAGVLAIESVVFVWVHAKYGEITAIILSGVLGLLMAFIAYGRMALKPIF